MTVISEEADTTEEQPKMITFGMFPQLQVLTEEDFKSAEWRDEDQGETVNLLTKDGNIIASGLIVTTW